MVETHLHSILQQHARETIYLLFRRGFEPLCNLLNDGLQSEDQEWEGGLEDLNDLIDEVPGLAGSKRDRQLGNFRLRTILARR